MPTSGAGWIGSVTVGTQSLLVQQVAGCLLDIDGDSLVMPEKDAPLLIRYLLGFRGAELISGFTLGSRDTATKIEDFMGSGSQFDVFGRSPSAPNAMTDGLVLSRLMLGVSDANLLGGVQLPAGAQFVTASAIRANVNLQCGTAY